jgi:hypothetical protein
MTTRALWLVCLLSGCVHQLDGDGEAETSTSQDALTCSGGCCGSRFNCAVPDADRREGCGGARIENPATGSCEWPLRAGAARTLYDGLGQSIGTVRSDAVRLNQGIRKRIDGRSLVYAFSITARMNDGSLRPASGWIAQADLTHARQLDGYTLALRDPGQGHYETRWRVTGGDPASFADLVLRSPGGATYPATDYLVRPFGMIHLTYSVPGFNLGGHATDSFRPGVEFRRARSVPQIEIALFGPRGHRSSRSLHFVYGYVHDGEQRRYGWIAKEALEAIEARPPPSSVATCSARCCDGTIFSGLDASSASACVSASSPVCERHGLVLTARHNGEASYERDRFCWAKCSHREAYHRVEGVTSGCTEAAAAFCAQNDRGALEDAMWDPCQPE